MNTLTVRQANVLAFIKAYTAENGYAPSYENIAEGVGLKSKSNIHYIVKRLEDRGSLSKGAGHARSYKMPNDAEKHLRRLLERFQTHSTLSRDDRVVTDALRFLRGGAA